MMFSESLQTDSGKAELFYLLASFSLQTSVCRSLGPMSSNNTFLFSDKLKILHGTIHT